ncbi:Intraflagellar transport protein 88 homolog [Coccomyxa sp. Obi]|nr:Intraflagellar transport protein 88 homolog [Coccomyxa sp. Obi]
MQVIFDRVKTGCLLFERLDFLSAVKQWRIAVDQVPLTEKTARSVIMRNIGIAFVQLERYQDAMVAFEGALDNHPDRVAAYNRAVLSYALGDPDHMKQAFLTLIQVHKAADVGRSAHPQAHEETSGAHHLPEADRQILCAARLIAPALGRGELDSHGAKPGGAMDPQGAKSGGSTSASGWDFCAGALAAEGFADLAVCVRLAEACAHMRACDFDAAERTLQDLESGNLQGSGQAAVSLSSLRLLQNRLQEAEALADLALTQSRSDPQALVCLGNAKTAAGNLEQARDLYADALTLEASYYHAQYNYALVSKRLGYLEDALSVFKQLHDAMPDNAEVMCQVADVLDKKEEPEEALPWLEHLHAQVPADISILTRIGRMHAKLGATDEAVRWLAEAHKAAPTNLGVLTSLLELLMEHKAYEKAVPVLETAARLQQQEVKWQLMHAFCLRQTRPAPVALAAYQRVHLAHPHNLECLAHLKEICTNLGMHEDARVYAAKARKVERASTAEKVIRPTSRGSGSSSQPSSYSNLNVRPASAMLKGPTSSSLPQPRASSNSNLNVVPPMSARSLSPSSLLRPASAARSGSRSSLAGHVTIANAVPPSDVWRHEDVAADLLPS